MTNELQERQHRWSQIESLCGFNIISNVNPSTPVPSDSRSSSNVAQALANVANIGSVGSGRKISDNNPPTQEDFDNDPPPTYSSVAVQNSPNLGDCRPLKAADSLEPLTVSSKAQNATERDQIPRNLSQASLVNGRSSFTNGSSNGLDHPDINGHMDSCSNHSPPASKTKKKWFGSKKDIDFVVNGDTEEESRRRKIKWLWRSAALKSTAKRKELLIKENDKIS